LPAGSPAKAAEQHRGAVARALSCVSRAHVIVGGGYLSDSQPRALVLNAGNPVTLRGSSALALSVAQQFAVMETPDGWQAHVTAYFYTLADAAARELLAFHWHPAGPSRIRTPHLHVGVDIRVGERWLPKVHIPTGPVAVQDVLALSIEELGTEPLRDDWAVILDQTR
jgi:hypothetical protein